MKKEDREIRNKKILNLLETKSQKEVAGIFGMSQGMIQKIYKRYNSHLKKSRLNMSSHSINVNYFEKIDTPEKSYWLGYICADGCINKDKISPIATIKVALAEEKPLEINIKEAKAPVKTVIEK